MFGVESSEGNGGNRGTERCGVNEGGCGMYGHQVEGHWLLTNSHS